MVIIRKAIMVYFNKNEYYYNTWILENSIANCGSFHIRLFFLPDYNIFWKKIPFSLNLTCDKTTTCIIVVITTLVFTEDRYL